MEKILYNNAISVFGNYSTKFMNLNCSYFTRFSNHYRLNLPMCLGSDSLQRLWNSKNNTYAKIKHKEAHSIFG